MKKFRIMLNLDKNKKYLLACSYGPDSMALFDMLIKEKYNFEVAHVNYHLREESDFEERSLKAYCDSLNIPIHIKNVTKKISRNLEATCREIRYEFFKDIYANGDFDGLLVAHNEDDHLETYFLQKQRKNLVKNYGIADKTIIKEMLVYRPLLAFSKQELLSYCEKNHIPYSIDKTNLLPIYKRNQIRISLVSKMDRSKRDVLLTEINNKNAEVNEMLKKVQKVSNKVSDIIKLEDIELAYYLDRMINKDKFIFPLTHNNIIEVRKMLISEKPNIRLSFNRNNYEFVKEYDRLFFRKKDTHDGFAIMMFEPDVIDNEYFYANFLGDTTNRNIHPNDYPLLIRTYHKGDKYKIKDYEVLVRRLYIDWKMPTSLRSRWPIIENANGEIIYIPRYRKDFKPDENCNFYVKECFTLK